MDEEARFAWKMQKLTETLRDYDKRFLQDDSDKNDLAIALKEMYEAHDCSPCFDPNRQSLARDAAQEVLERIMPEEFHV